MNGNVLAIDTETTRFRKNGGAYVEGQARVVQLALILTKPCGKIIFELNTLVKPDGWTISEGARNVHKITDEDCQAHGLDMMEIFPIYSQAAALADTIVSHGNDFDRGMMEIEAEFCNMASPRNAAWFCTMSSNRHLNNGKNASLETCLQHYCGRSLGDSAHNAMSDAEAALDIYFAMKG